MDNFECGLVNRIGPIRPGDTLVVSFPSAISPDVMPRVSEILRERLELDDSIRILVIDQGARFQVIAGDEDDLGECPSHPGKFGDH